MKNQIKTTMLLAFITGLFIALGQMVGGNQGAAIALIAAAAMNFVGYWYSDKIVLAMYRGQEVDAQTAPRLWRIVQQLSRSAQLPMPKVYVISTDTANAFATGRNPEHASVAVTTGLLELLDDEELEGVVAHELAHIGNRDILVSTVAATFAGAISWLASMVKWSFLLGGRSSDEDSSGLGALAMAFIAPVIGLILQLAISRSREFLADERAAKLTRNPAALARALAKISASVRRQPFAPSPGAQASAHMFIANPFGALRIHRLLSTHPPVEERINRLEALHYAMA